MNNQKRWYTSKTLWVNAVAAGLIALEASVGMIQPFIPVNFYVVMSIVLPVINAMLRVITASAIK